MFKFYLMKKTPFIVGLLWFLYQRRFLIDRMLILLTQKAFVFIGNRFPQLSFLKTT
jgi:hypothetical protein